MWNFAPANISCYTVLSYNTTCTSKSTCTVFLQVEAQVSIPFAILTRRLTKATLKCHHMAVATSPVGPVSTGPLFRRKVMNIQHNHALNCLFRAHTSNLLPACSRHVFKFALMAVKELYQRSLLSPIILRKTLHYPTNRSGNQNRCCALPRVIGSVAGCFCTTTKVKMSCFTT